MRNIFREFRRGIDETCNNYRNSICFVNFFSSDHGSKFLSDVPAISEQWTKQKFAERYSILLAIRSPVECSKYVYNDITLVNLYRYIFSCITRTEPGYLVNQFYAVNYASARRISGKILKFPSEQVITWTDSQKDD